MRDGSWYSPRHMAQDQPVAALVVALTGELAPAVYSINRLRPESLCFVLPESAKALVEADVQPRISQMPRRWDWVLLPDPEHFPSCYQTIARTLPGMLLHNAMEEQKRQEALEADDEDDE